MYELFWKNATCLRSRAFIYVSNALGVSKHSLRSSISGLGLVQGLIPRLKLGHKAWKAVSW